MRRRYFASAASVRLAVVDMLATGLSVAIAIGIRANFRYFFVAADEALILGPLVMLLRFATLAVFEHYSYSPTVWQSRDVVSLFSHSLFPTGVLVLLRLFSPLSYIRFPFSIILMEYVFSVTLMLLYRALQWKERKASDETPRYRPRVLIYGELQEMRHSGIVAAKMNAKDEHVIALLSPNPLHWDTELDGVRVVGDEGSLEALLSTDDSISILYLHQSEMMPKARVEHVTARVQALGMQIRFIPVPTAPAEPL